MTDKDKVILKKLFILLDYCRKIHNVLDDDDFINVMNDKVSNLKSKLSFRYRRKNEVALRYLVQKI